MMMKHYLDWQKKAGRLLAFVLAAQLTLTGMPSAVFAETGESIENDGEDASSGSDAATTTAYTFDAAEALASYEKSAAVAVGTKFGTDNYFTVAGTADAKRANSGTYSLETGKAWASYLQFEVTGTAEIKLTVSSTGSSNTSAFQVRSADGTVVVLDNSVTGSTGVAFTCSIDEAGTYQIGTSSSDRGVRILSCEVEETTGGTRAPRKDWSQVDDPAISSITVDKGNVIVSYDMVVGYDGADDVAVTMSDTDGNALATKAGTETDGSVTFTPSSSGTYSFDISASREGEDAKSGEAKSADFVLPLSAPAVSKVYCTGAGGVMVEWDAVKEAEYYIVTVNGEDNFTTQAGELSAELSLTVGETYTIGVKACRSEEDQSAIGVTAEITVVDEKQQAWGFTVYGTSTDTAHNGYAGSFAEDQVTVYSLSGKGKIVPNTTDGLSFYYTVMDPETQNFTLEADIHVDQWTLSNGQDGFGLMVSDTIGVSGSTDTVWNNSILAMASKVGYYYDGTDVTTDTTASLITMKLGVGVLARLGVTAEDIASFKSTGMFDGAATPSDFTTETTTLETSCGSLGTGTYNIIGNYTSEPTGNQADKEVTDLHLSIQRNNTGYLVSYSDMDGNLIGSKMVYDLERNALTQIESDKIYVGFFASRNAKITATNISLTTIDPADDAPAEGHEITYTEPVYQIQSANVSNTEDYNLDYYGNADGALTIKSADGEEIYSSTEVTANTVVTVPVKLVKGENSFTISFAPNADYKPGEYKELSDYEEKTFTYVVTYESFDGTNIHVSPTGTEDGTGTAENPVDIYTAVKYAAPGQKILLAGGTYELTSGLTIARGIDGTETDKIYMIADPESEERPVLDFMSTAGGFVIAGDYWYFQGFDVTRSKDASKGITLCGSNNVLDGLRTYKNGNTGIQVSRYLTSDQRDLWPANNLIKNCTSFLNADKGYEDADGFAAKLTCGDGNVFDGCISAYNADDGWDLYAKAETGSIGKVTLKNCVTFKNGYILDENGNEIDAGNGNGFKMGGESMSGYHTLIDSIAFANKAKGFDSNSCPDIQLYTSISFDNESYNVALYTNNAINTDYLVQGIVSYKVSNGVEEQYKGKGTQDESKVMAAGNYFTYGVRNSYDINNVKVSDEWFESLDTQSVLKNAVAQILDGSFGLYGITADGAAITRNTNGTVNTNGYLTLTSLAEADAGLYANGNIEDSASEEIDTTEPEQPLLQGLNQADDGNWYYYTDGQVDTGVTRLVEKDTEKWYVVNGQADFSVTGLIKSEGKWYYVANGIYDSTYTGMAKNRYGWWYVKNGTIDFTYTGLAKNQWGWWYMKNGKLDLTYTGLAKNQYGWYYVKNGKYDSTYTGMAKNQYGWWYVTKGKLNSTYTGLGKNAYGTWYFKNGKLMTSFSGKVKIGKKTYTIQNGKVVS